MKRRFTFVVSVIGCNADTFAENYFKYIVKREESYMDNVNFTLYATREIYDEISYLKEEGIEIVGVIDDANTWDDMGRKI